MTTIVWNRPVEFSFNRSETWVTRYTWDEVSRVRKQKPYHVVIDGDQSVIDEILSLDTVKEKKFAYKPLRKPTTVYYHGKPYRIWHIKGA